MAGIKEFEVKLAEDKKFAEGFEKDSSKDELLSKIKSAGFDVTEDELKAFVTESGELTDEQIDKVAGGMSRDVSSRMK